MLTANELAAMRATLDASLPQTAMIVAPLAASPEDSGGFVDDSAWSVVEAEVACRVGPASGDEAESGGRIVARASHRITMPCATSVSADDVVIVDGRAFEVLDVSVPRSWDLALRASCVERFDLPVPTIEEPTP